MALPRRAAAGSLAVATAIALAFALWPAAGARAADGPRVLRIRHHTAPDHTRVVLDLDRACSFEARRVEGPDRIALNLHGASFANAAERPVGDALVHRIRCNPGTERAQVVIDLAGRRDFRAFSLPPEAGKPDRIVIDILQAEAAAPPGTDEPAPLARMTPADTSGPSPVGSPADARNQVAGDPAGADGGPAVEVAGRQDVPLVESPDGPPGEPPVELVAEPGGGTRPEPGTGAGAEDLQPAGARAASGEVDAGAVQEPALAVDAAAGAGSEAVAGPVGTPEPEVQPFVVVIDPGHGGNDPGAIRGSLQEKDIVLDIAREVARQLEKVPGCRVVLTRDRDVFLPLARRVEVARREKGDVFLSIHCNTHPRPAVSGMEVYFLSLQGATDREARELADTENAAGLVGLAPGGEHADLVVDILMDLKKTRVLQDSSRLAATLLTAADRSGVVAGRRVKQAGFQVLKNLAMPSALVEVAYLSNQQDYRLLGDQAGRRRLAGALVAGILDWRAGSAPAAPRAVAVAASPAAERWETVYRVRSGDSLWKLADRFGTTMNEIARRNNLSERQRELRIGQRLKLPARGVRP